jgi:uncharacterized protein (DUF2252 family)
MATAIRQASDHQAVVAERADAGKAARERAPRSSHSEWVTPRARRDPLDLLAEESESRVPELVPIRYGRMSESAFAYFRGGAYVMASDLSDSPVSGIDVQLCGDAHLANFGGFGAPDRTMIFDLNDFDETLPGPWEWDVKRLAASLSIAARHRGFSRKRREEVVRGAVGGYRQAMRSFAKLSSLDVWYSRLSASEIAATVASTVRPSVLKNFEKTVAKAKTKDSARAFEKLGAYVNGRPRITADPPLLVPIEDLLPDREAEEITDAILEMLNAYQATLASDRRRLLARYEFADLARKVVGVGSVGTRAWVLLMTDRDTGAPLFLQAKEAERSVLERFVGKSKFDNQGRRVVEGQRLMQAASDIFLGWLRTTGIDGVERDFYVRQLWDWKSSADLETMEPPGMSVYSQLCAWTLARAHSRSGDGVAIAAYLGSTDKFDRALARFAEAYADQNERDHMAFVEAIADGSIPAETGI